MTKANTLYRYTVRKSALPNPLSDLQNWDVYKVDNDFNAAATYRVIESMSTRRDGTIEYTCSCPAWKDLCKHVHWVKSLKLKMKSNPDIIGGKFDPSNHEWTFERNQPAD